MLCFIEKRWLIAVMSLSSLNQAFQTGLMMNTFTTGETQSKGGLFSHTPPPSDPTQTGCRSWYFIRAQIKMKSEGFKADTRVDGARIRRGPFEAAAKEMHPCCFQERICKKKKKKKGGERA